MRALMTGLVNQGSLGDYNDYGAAEQATMALGAIAEAMRTGGALSAEQSKRMEDSLKEIDRVLKDEHGYDPEWMKKALKTLETIFR
jgi:cytochrome c556